MAKQTAKANGGSRSSRRAPPAAAEPEQDLSFLDEVIEDPSEIARRYLPGAGVEDTEVRYYLYRKVEEGRKPDAFLFRCLAQDFEPEMIGERYGTGTYRIKVYVKDPEHPNGVIRGGGLFPVEMPPGYKPKAPADPAQASAPPAAAPTSGEPSAFERMFLEYMHQSSERTERLLQEISASRTSPNPMQTLEGLKQLAEIVKPPVAAPAEPPVPGFNATLAAAKALLELTSGMQRGGGDAPPADIETLVMSRGLSVIEKMIDKAIADKTAPGPGAVAALAAAPAGSAAAQPEEEGVLLFKRMVHAACAAAVAREDPGEYAEDAYRFISEGDLKTIATDPNWFSLLVGAVPECAVHQGWFTAARDRLVALAAEDGLITLTGSPPVGTVEGGSTPTVPPHGTPAGGSSKD